MKQCISCASELPPQAHVCEKCGVVQPLETEVDQTSDDQTVRESMPATDNTQLAAPLIPSPLPLVPPPPLPQESGEEKEDENRVPRLPLPELSEQKLDDTTSMGEPGSQLPGDHEQPQQLHEDHEQPDSQLHEDHEQPQQSYDSQQLQSPDQQAADSSQQSQDLVKEATTTVTKTAIKVSRRTLIIGGSIAVAAVTVGASAFVILRSRSNTHSSASTTGTGTPTTSAASKTILIGTTDSLSLVNAANGSQIWSFSPQQTRLVTLNTPPLLISGSHIYWSASDSSLTAIDLTRGKQVWNVAVAGPITELQATTTLVCVIVDGVLSAFDATSGALTWHMDQVGLGSHYEFPKSGNFILRGNTIYTTVSDIVTALDATTGTQLWQFTPSTLDSTYDVGGLGLSADGNILVIKYIGFTSAALYGVNTGSHQEAWHLDPTTTTSGFASHDMLLFWFHVTPDNHLVLSASFNHTPPDDSLQNQYRYLVLSDGSMLWSLPILSSKNLPSNNEGNGSSVVVGNGVLYSISGPTNGDLSAISLGNHQQIWSVPSSSSYDTLYLVDDVLLALSGSSSTLTAFRTRDGKQLWQQTAFISQIFIVGQSVFVEQLGQPGSFDLNVLDPHSGQKRWSTTVSIGNPLETVLSPQG